VTAGFERTPGGFEVAPCVRPSTVDGVFVTALDDINRSICRKATLWSVAYTGPWTKCRNLAVPSGFFWLRIRIDYVSCHHVYEIFVPYTTTNFSSR